MCKLYNQIAIMYSKLVLVFLFQACRGERLDPGITLRIEPTKTEVDCSTASYKIPKHADFLITFSTYDGKFKYLEYQLFVFEQ